jgi:hypothetical protein
LKLNCFKSAFDLKQNQKLRRFDGILNIEHQLGRIIFTNFKNLGNCHQKAFLKSLKPKLLYVFPIKISKALAELQQFFPTAKSIEILISLSPSLSSSPTKRHRSS